MEMIRRIIDYIVRPPSASDIDPNQPLAISSEEAISQLVGDVNYRIFWNQLEGAGETKKIAGQLKKWCRQNPRTDPLPHLRGMLQNASLQLIENATKVPEATVAFFLPSRSFHGHFGDLPGELSDRGLKVIHFFGTVEDEKVFANPGNFLLIGDMSRRVTGPKMIITAQIMDCLPDNVFRVLIDHLSFARFDMDAIFKRLDSDKPITAQTTSEIIQDVSAYVAFFPLVDVHIVPTTVLFNTVEECAVRLGYFHADATLAGKAQISPHADNILKLLNGKRLAEKCMILPGGYPKLDTVYKESSNYQPENIITYSPTPNDVSGNKDGSEWANFMSVNDYGAAIVTELCKAFPDFKIVFKPHADEFKEVVERVVTAGSAFPNFEMDRSGSNYWKLYQKTKVLVSDFSSTAFTFSMAMNRPVAFFSHNEEEVLKSRADNSYCKHRSEIGEVCRNTTELVATVTKILESYESYTQKITTARRRYCFNPGDSKVFIADELMGILKHHDNPEQLVLYRAPTTNGN